MLNAVRYFTSERDGGDVVHSVLSRKPANLTDRRATVYADPIYDSNDNLVGKLRKIAGPVDVSGGWFDAGGGYEKFAYTTSYADGLMLLAARDFPGQYQTLGPEAGYGLSWLEKLWNPTKKVLYDQVGIGNGNASNTIQGDYNFWFLPQAEDRLRVKKGGQPGPTAYYVKYRPVFEAAAAGHKIDPDFAGRFAADFALAAQIAAQGHRRADRAKAERLLALARGVYAMAKTSHIGQLITAYPHDYYPGSQWKSDMLWGGAEITLAEEALHAPRHEVQAAYDVAQKWAAAYMAQGHPVGGDTLNLYETGAIGEAELLQASRDVWSGVKPGAILADLARQLAGGRGLGPARPVRAGHRPGPVRRRAARLRAVHHQRAVPAVRRLGQVPGVRPAAAQLRAGRQRLGHHVRGRRREHVPALHAERDRQPGRVADRDGATSSSARLPTGRAARATSSAWARSAGCASAAPGTSSRSTPRRWATRTTW